MKKTIEYTKRKFPNKVMYSKKYQLRQKEKPTKKSLLKLWGQVILARDKRICQVCGQFGNNPHHIFTKQRNNTAFDIDNGITLCAKHHTLDSTFSPHLASKNWWIWLEGKKGKKWVDDLEKRSQMDGCRLDLNAIKLYLTNELKRYETKSP